LASVFQDGSLVRRNPDLYEIRRFHQEQLRLFWPEYLRIKNPEIYPVYYSEEVWNLKQNMIQEINRAIRQDGK
jgi:nicotinate phosphoribosyltransferase